MARIPFDDVSRTTIGAVTLAAVVLLAGCGGAGGGTTTGGTTTAPATSTGAATTTGGATTTAGTTTGGTTAAGTTTSGTTTAGTTTAGTTTTTASNGGSMQSYGTMTVLIGTKWVDLDGRSAGVRFSGGNRLWSTNSTDVTISEALQSQGIALDGNTLTYNGTTYDGSQNGTYVQVRVNGEPVDPTTYTLSDNDSVWIAVSTPQTQFDPPGEYIHDEYDHVHGSMNVTIDGKTFDFSRSKFQGQDRYFHFENGDGSEWHAHSYQITLQYAMRTLGFDVTRNSVTYNGTTYRNGDAGTTVKVLVNGESVDPAHYRLMDGDSVRIVVEQNGS